MITEILKRIFLYENKVFFIFSYISIFFLFFISVFFLNSLIFYLSILLLLVIIYCSQILISKLIVLFYLFSYLIPYFIFPNFYIYLNFEHILKPLHIILIFCSFVFITEFIILVFTNFDMSRDKFNLLIKYNKLTLISIIYIFFLLLLFFLNILDFYNGEFKVSKTFDYERKYYDILFQIPVLGQILKKIYFFGFVYLFLLGYFKKNYIVYFTLLLLFLINGFFNTSRSEVVLSMFSLLIFLLKYNSFYVLICLLTVPIFSQFTILIRGTYNLFRVNEVQYLDFKNFKIYFSEIWNNLELNGLSMFNQFILTFYERLIFLDEYLTVYFNSQRANEIKYLLNLILLIPTKIREIFIDITILPFSNQETKSIGLNNIGDNISTVSLGHISESIYILDNYFFIVPSILGLIITLYQFILNKLSNEFYIIFSLFMFFLLISKESFSAISLDFIIIFLFTYLSKKILT